MPDTKPTEPDTKPAAPAEAPQRNPEPTPEDRRAAILAHLNRDDPDPGAAFGDREFRVARAMIASEEHAPAWGELKVPQKRIALHEAVAFLRSGTREARLVNALLAQG